MSTRLTGDVEKGWGSEVIFASNDLYCGKLLKFNTGKKFSMHMHQHKDETWYVLTGEFKLKLIDTKTADQHEKLLFPGDVWRNKPMQPHQLECISEGIIIEVSTPDSVEDNFRVQKGDSQ